MTHASQQPIYSLHSEVMLDLYRLDHYYTYNNDQNINIIHIIHNKYINNWNIYNQFIKMLFKNSHNNSYMIYRLE